MQSSPFISQYAKCTPPSSADILSPRPLRRLKRIFTKDSDDLPLFEDRPSKRPCLLVSHLPSFYNLEPTIRSRSDGFLIMSRPHRDTQPPVRYRSNTDRSNSVGPYINTSHASPVSFSSGSVGSTWSRVTTPASTRSSTSSNHRIQSPTYRDNLRVNMIEIEPDTPDDKIVDTARKIFGRTRSSPGMSEEDAARSVSVMRKFRRDAEEDTIKEGFVESGIVPGLRRREGITKSQNLLFDGTNIPHVPLGPPLPKPKPDCTYGFDRSLFSPEEKMKQSTTPLRGSSAPTSGGFWPFFVVEFKSQAKLGTQWVAENQAATSGAIFVKSIEKLLQTASQGSDPIKSLAFSCIMDAKNANFWVHYLEAKTGIHASVEVKQCYLGDTSDVIYCRNTFRNILDWAIETRLPEIHQLLKQIAIPDLETAHKQQRTRSPVDSPSSSKRGSPYHNLYLRVSHIVHTSKLGAARSNDV